MTHCKQKSRRINALIPAFVLALVTGVLSSPLQADPEVEIMHWWDRGGDARAMRVFKDEFVVRGGTWHNVAGENSVDVLNQAISRFAKGYAPTLVQWNSIWEVGQIRNLGLLGNIDQNLAESLENSLIENVLEMVTVDNNVMAVPVTVHSENWLWYKPGKDKASSKAATTDWSEFIDYAKNLADENRVALAVGNDSAQQRTLFNNVLLGIAGQQLFEIFYTDLNIAALDSPKFLKAVSTFKALRPYSESFGEGRWEQQVAAVAASRAFGVVMSDEAKGEFRNLGLRLGRHYDCAPAPGTSDNIMLLIDMFVLGQVRQSDEKLGQQLFVEVATDSNISETFNYLKGSISPLKNIDTDVLDHCSKKAYQTLNKKGAAIRPHASIGDRGFLASIDSLINTLWVDDIETHTWIEQLSAVIKEENAKRTANLRASAQ